MFRAVYEFHFLHHHQHLVLSAVYILADLLYVKWYHILVLIFISLIINKVEHTFISLLAIQLSSLIVSFQNSCLFVLSLQEIFMYFEQQSFVYMCNKFSLCFVFSLFKIYFKEQIVLMLIHWHLSLFIVTTFLFYLRNQFISKFINMFFSIEEVLLLFL